MTTYVVPRADAGLEWGRWAGAVVSLNPSFVQLLHPGMKWQDFAIRMALVEPAAPRPEEFETWEEWGTALRRALNV